MRVIAGEFKGRKLEAPPSDSKFARPTGDRVKEAIFSILTYDIFDAVVADFFSGTGSLGIEAISRGARHCYFVDSSLESVRLIKRNISHCKADSRSTVFHIDFNKSANIIREKVDLVLADPPYECGYIKELLTYLVAKRCELLNPEALIVIEHSAYEDLPILPELELLKTRKYGKTRVSVFQLV